MPLPVLGTEHRVAYQELLAAIDDFATACAQWEAEEDRTAVWALTDALSGHGGGSNSKAVQQRLRRRKLQSGVFVGAYRQSVVHQVSLAIVSVHLYST